MATSSSSFTPPPLGRENNVEVGQPPRALALQSCSKRVKRHSVLPLKPHLVASGWLNPRLGIYNIGQEFAIKNPQLPGGNNDRAAVAKLFDLTEQ
ncbi:hypothetical protein TNCV_4351051 [Trichonephila clavipes]|nr:hypothetical protein TNCV_4351051 [Trichonephila clavipes]